MDGRRFGIHPSNLTRKWNGKWLIAFASFVPSESETADPSAPLRSGRDDKGKVGSFDLHLRNGWKGFRIASSDSNEEVGMGSASLHSRVSFAPGVELQIPPLRCAPVGMTNCRLVLRVRICAMDGKRAGDISLGLKEEVQMGNGNRHSETIKKYFRDQDETDDSSALCLCQRDMRNAVLR